MRLDKFICYSTELDRAQARANIWASAVSVNGEICQDEAKQVHENNHITLLGQVLTPRAPRYIMLHKPASTLCSHADGAYPSLFRGLTLNKAEDLHLVGRLDADTTGLVLLTDDGRWSYHITHPNSGCNKVYRVTLRDPLSTGTAQLFNQGIRLQGEAKLTLPAQLESVTATEVLLTIVEGRFHQVKRMFAAVGNKVVALHRDQIGGIQLDVPVGEWRHLTAQEVMSTSGQP
ncbi:16S rRNA pseudouridine(516) synthase [Oceanisphaera profunda]|uniref:Pseudouridine synthase n=1 Tax=Oceanisphaera profunda TaxID=1416627 RepID=A0A1Y0D568_9GAMM|nr:pseudouridine synthase [Oceanisphaera profunda]ART82659.1 16S rRNA pseudouridine(516) synthase [Oceanisphaera profunda]